MQNKQFLTGDTYIPDNRPDLKANDIEFSLFFASTIQDAIRVLLVELPYWARNQHKETADVAKVVIYYLKKLIIKHSEVLPPLPTDINCLLGWVLFVDIYSVKQAKANDVKNALKATIGTTKKNYTTQKQALKTALSLIDTEPNLSRATLIRLIGCSKGTFRKIIEHSPTLQGYFGIDPNKAPAPRKETLTDKQQKDLPSIQYERLPDPNETQTILENLLEDVAKNKPEVLDSTKDQIEAMTLDEKQGLAKLCEGKTLKKEKTQKQHKKI